MMMKVDPKFYDSIRSKFPGKTPQYLTLTAIYALSKSKDGGFLFPFEPEEIAAYRTEFDREFAKNIIKAAVQKYLYDKNEVATYRMLDKEYHSIAINSEPISANIRTLPDGGRATFYDNGTLRNLVGSHGQEIARFTPDGRVQGRPTGFLHEDRRTVEHLFDIAPFPMPGFPYWVLSEVQPIDLARMAAMPFKSKNADEFYRHFDSLFALLPPPPAPRLTAAVPAPGMRMH